MVVTPVLFMLYILSGKNWNLTITVDRLSAENVLIIQKLGIAMLFCKAFVIHMPPYDTYGK